MTPRKTAPAGTMGSKLRSTKMILQTGTLTTGKPIAGYLIGPPQASSNLGDSAIGNPKSA